MAETDPPGSPSQRNVLLTIIKQNDLSRLHQCVASSTPEDVLVPTEVNTQDAFFVAATHGSPETLRVLLEVYAAAPEVVERFRQRRLSLLHDACGAENLDIVRFILDIHKKESQLSLGTVDLHGRDGTGKTPILAAAASLVYLYLDADGAEEYEGADRNGWIQDRIARGQQLIHFFLDQRCSATDVIPPFPNTADNRQPRDSVLGLAVSRASGRLVQRLIDHGADVYLKQQHFHDRMASLQFRNGPVHAYNVTTLHLASLFWNAGVVKLLLDHHHRSKNENENHTGPDLASSRDAISRLPLHWAAAGPGHPECRLPDEEISLKISETFRLLLKHNPMGINFPDDTGTPLHYAAATHATCGASQHAELAIRTLLEHGAEPSIPNGRGQTVLHLLGYGSQGRDPIRTRLLDLLMAHRVNINHADQNGNTALHIMDQNLSQILTARFLLNHGADIRVTNAKGETPFHAMA